MDREETIIGVRGRTLVAWVAALVVAAALPPRSAKTEEPAVERFFGRYEARAEDAGAAVIEAAIDSATGSMRRLRRKIARRRLRALNPPVPSLTVAPNGDGLLVRYEGSRENRTPRLGVFATNRSADGGEVRVRHDAVGGRLHETYRSEDGGAVNAFSLSNDGRELSLLVTLESDRLPKPVVYRLEFIRSE